jgi:4-carboxymuconolactone decarboxylase
MPRLPQIFEKDQLPEANRDVIDYLVRTRGAVSPGFAALLNSPEATARIAHLGSFIRFESSLPDRIRELAALTASRELGGVYEQTIHTRDARNLGVPESTIEAVNNGSDLDGLDEDDALPVRCARELLRDHELSDSTFEAARKRLGDQGVVDLAATIGYYSMLACLHNALLVRHATGQ